MSNRAASTHTFTPRWQWLILLGIPVSLCAVWYLWGGNEAWDDAFISFRYAQNLAWGRGLVWNPGSEPTQGYTNFLVVVLVAAGIRIGLFPVVTAFFLNVIGVMLTVLSFNLLARYLLPKQPAARLLPVLAIACMPLTQQNVITGMETVFWTGLVFTAAAAVLQYTITGEDIYLAGFVASAFLSSLTRPEAVLFAALWLLILLVQGPGRRQVIVAGAVFGGLGLVYALWLRLYFGDVLPNPFYVKVDQPGIFPGLHYVTGFVLSFAAQPLLYPGLVGLFYAINRNLLKALPYAVVLVLPVFYLFTSPLVGSHFRFLYPTACLLIFMLAVGYVHLFAALSAFLQRGPFVIRSASQALLIGLALVAFFVPALLITQQRFTAGLSDTVPPHNITRTAQALASVPGIEQAIIAYGDAGKVSYYTDAQFLDVVGLNNNTIARQGPENGPDWVVDYVLDQQPDLLSFYTHFDGTIFNLGHGVIGASYSDLYQRPAFQENYSYIGGFDYDAFYAHWFVRNDTPLRAAVTDALRRIADVTHYEFIP